MASIRAIRVRLDEKTKRQATQALAKARAMGRARGVGRDGTL